ncbi:hypothetical protein GE061_008887 [Apolygus lucorum]|uniref:Uncharacterized protein n=1 Tax=Apolygus lucorum TaxID=248454 RepID=A0A6A4KI02_APOLU|nr:hypothetical protein GE061_008887 [Apolygus lucorum]
MPRRRPVTIPLPKDLDVILNQCHKGRRLNISVLSADGRCQSYTGTLQSFTSDSLTIIKAVLYFSSVKDGEHIGRYTIRQRNIASLSMKTAQGRMSYYK